MTNKEVVEALYAGFAAGDIPAVTALMAEDIEWNEAGRQQTGRPQPPISVRTLWSRECFNGSPEDFEQFEVDIDTIISEGDLVVTEGR